MELTVKNIGKAFLNNDNLNTCPMCAYHNEKGLNVKVFCESCGASMDFLEALVMLENQQRESKFKIYVASSWRNETQTEVVNVLRNNGFEVYDYKNPELGNYGFHWSEIGSDYKRWSPEQFKKALSHPIAEKGFGLDMKALIECDICVLVLPCNRSAHLEAGYAIGSGKPTIIMLQDCEVELMYKMTPYICTNIDEVLKCLTLLGESK